MQPTNADAGEFAGDILGRAYGAIRSALPNVRQRQYRSLRPGSVPIVAQSWSEIMRSLDGINADVMGRTILEAQNARDYRTVHSNALPNSIIGPTARCVIGLFFCAQRNIIGRVCVCALRYRTLRGSGDRFLLSDRRARLSDGPGNRLLWTLACEYLSGGPCNNDFSGLTARGVHNYRTKKFFWNYWLSARLLGFGIV